MKTGYKQYLFKAKSVNAFCTDEIIVTRSKSWLHEDGNTCASNPCTETITISVSTIKAADPTATVVSIINDSDSAEVKAAKQLCQDDDQTQWNINSNICENKCNDVNTPWYNTANNRCEAPNAASLDAALESESTKATLNIFESFGTGNFGFGVTSGGFGSTTTTTTTTTSTVTSGGAASQCASGEYYSFIKKKCIVSASSGSAPVPVAIPEKTEEEKLAESSSSINDAFSSFSTTFGTSTDIFGAPKPTKSEIKVHSAAKAPTMDIQSAFGFFSGDTSTQATIFAPTAPVTFEAPEVGKAATVATESQADSIFASMFSGGFGGFSFGF